MLFSVTLSVMRSTRSCTKSTKQDLKGVRNLCIVISSRYQHKVTLTRMTFWRSYKTITLTKLHIMLCKWANTVFKVLILMVVLQERKKKGGRKEYWIKNNMDWCSFHGPGYESYHDGHLNRLPFLWKFTDKHMVF